MNMIKAIIIDTEESVRESLTNQLSKCSENVVVVAGAMDVETGIHEIKTHNPDIVFLDVNLSGGSGFDIIQYFSNKTNGNQAITSKFVFTTSCDKYAFKAIKLRAFDYLLKPIDINDLENTINKFKSINDYKLSNAFNGNIFENIYKYKRASKKIALNTSERIYIYQVTEIVRCESQNNYTMFYFKDDKPVCVCKSIKVFEQLLSEYGFERVHQSHLINMRYLKTYEKTAGGYIIMDDGSSIPVAQRKKENFLKKLREAV